MTPFLVVANAMAGSAERERVQAAVEELRGHADTELVMTDHLEALDAALAGAGDRTLVVAGGDGSIHAAVGSLWRSGTLGDHTIGLLPLGTGNDLATGLDLPSDPVDAARVCVEGRPRTLDLIVTDPGFDERDHVTLNRYCAGEVKEGVAMGGALSLVPDGQLAAVRDRFVEICDRLGVADVLAEAEDAVDGSPGVD